MKSHYIHTEMAFGTSEDIIKALIPEKNLLKIKWESQEYILYKELLKQTQKTRVTLARTCRPVT